ncbi:MAG TPA: Mur ligase family protein [Acidimicrobiales bacterium]|nr:Mur ligase family protein [Acidimicrobiales bacterium]
MTVLAIAATLVGAGLAGVRWLRVAQREHYLPGSVTRFAARWWRAGPNLLLGLAVVLGIVLAQQAPLTAVAGSAALAAGPFGLSLRGRTSALAWTRRLRTLTGVWVALHLLLVGVGVLAGVGPPVAALAATLTPLLIDAALAITAPLERRRVGPFVASAATRLAQVSPTVLAITGSYGKTTIKGYVAHLVAGSRSVVPTPASFNNRAGLARAVNEHLAPGTEVFVAEMGTYGKGEIADLCRWCPPEVAVISAIGPVHLERMGTEEAIVAAKAEILEGARVAILNVDHPLLARLAGQREAAGQRVVRCSAAGAGGATASAGHAADENTAGIATASDDDPLNQTLPAGRATVSAGHAPDATTPAGGPPAAAGTPIAEVRVADGVVLVDRRRLGTVPKAAGAAPTNVACAVAAALEVGVPEEAVAARLATLPTAPHRLSVSQGQTGATIIDDTYNANPAGAAVALAALDRHASSEHRRVVVTPGMVELGPVQEAENRRLAAAAARAATHLVVVGHTNRAALVAGAAGGRAELVLTETRDEAVAWVRQHVGQGDVVLYENDLPDHFP